MSGKIIAKSFLLKNHFDGLPKEEDFELVEKVLPPLADDEFLCESLYLSVDPYMRPYSTQIKKGSLMIGSGVAKVIESKNSTYPVGTIVSGHCGWTTHFIPMKSVLDSKMFHIVPADLRDVSHAIGALGLTGLTAYFGFLDICQPKSGETVFVNTAAGAVGSIVGQIAKIKGCHVVGCTSSDEKIAYLKEIGFDGTFNYKTENLEEKLKELCPKGIDCFFDNVGGSMFDTVMSHMNRYGRVSVCGSISSYNEKDLNKVKGPYIHNYIIHKELKIQGFLAPSYYHRYDEGVQNLHSWMLQGKLKAEEHILEGFLNMPKAFIGLFLGVNIGKVVVKV